MLRLAALSLGVLSVLVPSALAHDGIHERIEAITRELERSPSEPALYVKRAELHREHGDTKAALADLAQADKLGSTRTTIELVRGRLHRDLGNLKASHAALDRYVAAFPNDFNGYASRAQTLEQLEDFKSAIKDWDAALAKSDNPNPDLYVAQAKCRARLGGKNIDVALRGLESALERLGNATSLLICAIEIESAAGRVDAAVRRIDSVLEASQRKDFWLLRKADVLFDADRDSDALRAYEATLHAIAKLDPKRRRTERMLAAAQHVRARIAILDERLKRKNS